MNLRSLRHAPTSNPSGVTPSLWNYPTGYRITRAFGIPHGRQPVPPVPHSRQDVSNTAVQSLEETGVIGRTIVFIASGINLKRLIEVALQGRNLNRYSVDQLATADLIVDAYYEGGRAGNAGDDPLPRLLRVDSQGGFRKRGSLAENLFMLVLTSSMNDPDWPDSLDRETGIFTYYGDNKKPGRELHDTGRHGNRILQNIFSSCHSGMEGRSRVPPIFVFASAGSWRDVTFLGLAVPGASELEASEDLVAIWRTSGGMRFQNYRARFTILDAGKISRAWLDSIIAGQRDDRLAPDAWNVWVAKGRRRPLTAVRTLEYRHRTEQLPQQRDGEDIIAAILEHFNERPHAFEHFAASIAQMMIPDIAAIDVTRPSRDGGRDAIGQLRIGSGPSAIFVDFALEAKCYSAPNAVGVREMSRLISRLRHRQFGILVTTSCVDLQAYKEIKEDQHPIVIISAVDLVELLRRSGKGSRFVVERWLREEFPKRPGDPE